MEKTFSNPCYAFNLTYSGPIAGSTLRIAGSTLRKGAGGSRGGGESGVAAEWRAIANTELY